MFGDGCRKVGSLFEIRGRLHTTFHVCLSFSEVSSSKERSCTFDHELRVAWMLLLSVRLGCSRAAGASISSIFFKKSCFLSRLDRDICFFPCTLVSGLHSELYLLR